MCCNYEYYILYNNFLLHLYVFIECKTLYFLYFFKEAVIFEGIFVFLINLVLFNSHVHAFYLCAGWCCCEQYKWPIMAMKLDAAASDNYCVLNSIKTV